MESALIHIISWGLAFLMASVTGYPKGAPVGTCVSMFPHHGVGASPGEAPYRITLSGSTYAAGGSLTVTVSGTSAGISHRGVFLQARRANCSGDQNDAAIGTFSLAAAMMEEYQLRNCGGVNGSAVTHKNNTDKTDAFVSTWTAPAEDEGPIYFRATVVNTTHEFWTNVTSDIINGPSGAGTPAPEKCPVQTQLPAPLPTPLPTQQPMTTPTGAALTWASSTALVFSISLCALLFV